MRKKLDTRFDKLMERKRKINSAISELRQEREYKAEELDSYCKRHRSVNFNGLETKDVDALNKIYDYFDKGKDFIHQIDFGLRCDNRGMKLCYWLNDDADYLVIHLCSNHTIVTFSGATNWLVKAVTLEDKVNVIKKIKNDISNIIKGV